MSENAMNVSQMQSILQHDEGGGEDDDKVFAVLLHMFSSKSKLSDASIFAKLGSDQIGGSFNWLESALQNNYIIGGQGEMKFGLSFMVDDFYKGRGTLQSIIGDTDTLNQIMGATQQETMEDGGTSSDNDDAQQRDNQEAFYNMQEHASHDNDHIDHEAMQSGHAAALQNRRAESADHDSPER